MKRVLCIFLVLVLMAGLTGTSLALPDDPDAGFAEPEPEPGDIELPFVPIDYADPTVEPTAKPAEPPSVTLSADGSSAQVTGGSDGLYARIAIVLELDGESGLFVTQGSIDTDGSIAIPRFEVRGLTVMGVNVALVQTLDDIASPRPEVIASAFIRL